MPVALRDVPLAEAYCSCDTSVLCAACSFRAVSALSPRHASRRSHRSGPRHHHGSGDCYSTSTPQLTRLRHQFDEGLLVELFRGQQADPTRAVSRSCCIVPLSGGRASSAMLSAMVPPMPRPCIPVPLALLGALSPAFRCRQGTILSTASAYHRRLPSSTLERNHSMLTRVPSSKGVSWLTSPPGGIDLLRMESGRRRRVDPGRREIVGER